MPNFIDSASTDLGTVSWHDFWFRCIGSVVLKMSLRRPRMFALAASGAEGGGGDYPAAILFLNELP